MSRSYEANARACRAWYAKVKADPERYAEFLAKEARRRELKRGLVFESDYVRAGLAHLLKGAVEA